MFTLLINIFACSLLSLFPARGEHSTIFPSSAFYWVSMLSSGAAFASLEGGIFLKPIDLLFLCIILCDTRCRCLLGFVVVGTDLPEP